MMIREIEEILGREVTVDEWNHLLNRSNFLQNQRSDLADQEQGVRVTTGCSQTHRLALDRLRVNGGVLKSFGFSVHAEIVEA